MENPERQRGFSVLELLVSVAIMVALVAVSLVSFSSFSKREALDASASSIVFALRDARYRTMASVGASQYGVNVGTDRHSLFQGPVFSPTATSNQVYFISPLVRASSSISSFVFERVTGNSSASGTIDVYLVSDPSTKKTVRIQGTGLVDVQ